MKLKVLHGVCDIDLFAVDAGHDQRLVEHPPGGSHEWRTFTVLYVAGLFPNHDHRSFRRPGAEYRLGGMLIQVTPFTMPRGGNQFR